MNLAAKEYAEATERVLQRLRGTDPRAIASRKDPNKFCEYAFTDDSDDPQPIKQALHHTHLQKIMSEHRRAVVLYPVGFGKTTQLVMRIIWELGNDPTIRIIVIGANGDAPQKIIGSVAREITENKKVQEVFPELKPAVGSIRQSVDTWRGSALRISGAPTNQKDPSIASYGLDGKVSGSRAELIIVDNAMNFENTSSGHQRKKVIDRFDKEIMTRLVPKVGRVIITDTAWTKDDLPHTLMDRESWYAEVFDAETNPFGEGVLWEERFPADELARIKIDITTIPYDLTFRNIPLSESMMFFKQEYWDSSYGRVPYIDSLADTALGINLQTELRTGVDLATEPGEEHDLTAFSTVLASGHRMRLINLQSDRIQLPAILRRMVAIYRALHRPVNLAGGNAKFIVEDNAAQKYVVQAFKDADMLKAIGLTKDEARDIRVEGRTTTKKKRDRVLGVPALASGLEMGRWDIAPGLETKALREEMRVWYPGLPHYGDRLMATWLAMADMITTGATFTVDYI